MGASKRSRKTVLHANKNTWDWPQPDISEWGVQEKYRYTRFRDAISAYLAGDKVAIIEQRFSLRISQVQEQLARALELDGEGHILGFCALIPNLHIANHVRKKAPPLGPRPSGSSCKGGLMQLLNAEDLYDEFEARVLGKSKRLKVAKLSGVAMQKWLGEELVERGYKSTDYPFTTQNVLYSSICRLMKRIRDANMDQHIKAYGSPEEVTNLQVMSGRRLPAERSAPLHTVEIDEHKLHGIAVVRITVDGIEKRIPAERAVGIAICDRGTGAVLGGAVCLNPEAKADALIEAIRSAVIPGTEVLLPSGKEAPAFRPGDFCSSLMGTLWSVTCLDNAKIHVSDQYFSAAKRIGAQTCLGPLRSWSARPNIESVFSRLVRGKFGELPSTTSSNTDSRTNRTPAERAIACDIDHDEICTLFYQSLAKINTRISEGALNQTPIEVLINYFKSTHRPLLRRLPSASAANPEVGVIAIRTTVRRRSKKNANLYVAHATNKYTNNILAKRADLLGEEIVIHVSPNLQTVNAFEASGLPLGELVADGIWGKTAHTSDIKRAVNRDLSLRYMQHPDNLNPIQGLMQKKAMQVLHKNEKRAKGSVVKGALELQGMMQATKTEQLHVNTGLAPTIETNRTLTAAAERAKKAQKVRERLSLEKHDTTGK